MWTSFFELFICYIVQLLYVRVCVYNFFLKKWNCIRIFVFNSHISIVFIITHIQFEITLEFAITKFKYKNTAKLDWTKDGRKCWKKNTHAHASIKMLSTWFLDPYFCEYAIDHSAPNIYRQWMFSLGLNWTNCSISIHNLQYFPQNFIYSLHTLVRNRHDTKLEIAKCIIIQKAVNLLLWLLKGSHRDSTHTEYFYLVLSIKTIHTQHTWVCR